MEWQRPDSLAFPTVWSRFEGKPHGDRPPLKYIIQDITEDMIEDCIDHMTRYFLVRELWTSSIGFLEDKVSTEDFRELWRQTLKQRVGLVALVDDEEEKKRKIAGMNITVIVDLDKKKKDKNSLNEKRKGEAYELTIRALLDIEKDVDIASMCGTANYMAAYGLSVAPHYYGDGVGCHLLKARTPLCRALGIDLTVTTFSSPIAQLSAKKAGFETIASLDHKTYKQDGKLAFPRLDGTSLLMVKRIPATSD